MATSPQSVDPGQLLKDYKRMVLDQQEKIKVVLEKYASLEYQRAGLSQSSNLTDAKRTKWNQGAKEWRAAKLKVLAEAQRLHKPIYDQMSQMVSNLSGRDRDNFNRMFHTFNGYYTGVDAKLRASNLEDL